MPVLSITLMDVYDDETRTRLGERLTDAVRATIGAPLDGITVQIYEVKPTGYMRGRTRRVPGTPPPDAEAVVRDFLAAMEARELDAARGFLADDFVMHFPGAAPMTSLEQLIDWAASRYSRVGKSYDGIDVMHGEAGTVVYCFGTLSGTWLDGRDFEGIRFIDRFTVERGLIRDQRVWNDMAEQRSQSSGAAAEDVA